MQNIVITGRIGKDAELRTTGSGQNICNVTVASDQGFGDKKTTNWFRVAIWGKRGQSLAPYLLKGGQVTVSGELEVGEWEGKTQLNINANEITLQGGRKQGGDDTAKQSGWGDSQGGGGAFDSDLDDEVAFVSCDFALEHKRREVL